MAKDFSLNDEQKLFVEELLNVNEEVWEITDSKYDKETSSQLIIVNCKKDMENIHSSLRGVVIDITNRKKILNRDYLDVIVQNDLLVFNSKDGDICITADSAYENFFEKLNDILPDLDEFGKLNIKYKFINNLYTNIPKNESKKKTVEINKLIDKEMKQEVTAAMENLSIRNRAQILTLICCLFDLYDNMIYLTENKLSAVFSKCIDQDDSQNLLVNVIDQTYKLLYDTFEQNKNELLEAKFKQYYLKMLRCRTYKKLNKITNRFLKFIQMIRKDEDIDFLETYLNILSKRIFNENVIYKFKKVSEPKYYPVFEGYTITLFQYKNVKHVCTHKKFLSFDDNIVTAINHSVSKDIDEPLPSFTHLNMNDNDSVKFMYVDNSFLASSHLVLKENSSIVYYFENNLTNVEGRKELEQKATSLTKFEMTQDKALEHLKIGGSYKQGEALYCMYREGETKHKICKIFSKSYNKRFRIFSRNYTRGSDMTNTILANFIYAYEKKTDMKPFEQREIFFTEFSAIQPVSSKLTSQYIKKEVKELKPLTETFFQKYSNYLNKYEFRCAIVFTTMLYYCNKNRKKDLIQSMEYILTETNSLSKLIDQKNEELFTYSKRAGDILKIAESRVDKESKIDKYGKNRVNVILNLLENENPFSLAKLIKAKRNTNT